MEEATFTITNIAGIEHAELRLKPGVNVLRGRNATGKTSALRAITRAQGGAVELERRDGAEHGEISGPGIHLRVGKVIRTTGEAELSLAEVSPLSRLIDPSLKGTDEAARARIRALVELLNLRVDDAAVERLCGGDTDLEEWLQSQGLSDLMAGSEALRHELHARARRQESTREEAEGKVHAARERRDRELEEAGGPKALVDDAPDAARDALVGASRAYERACTECEARERLEAQQAELRETLGERPDSEASRLALLERQRTVEELRGAIVQLECQLAEARQSLAVAGEAQQAAEERISEIDAAADRWDAAQEILQRLPVGPTRGELDEIHAQTVEAAQDHLRRAQHSEAYHGAETLRIEATAERERADKEANRLRGLAAALPARLGEILANAGAQNLTVIDGRLHAIIDGKTLDFEKRLSDGQRVRAVLDIAAQVYADQVVPLSAGYWSSLDPDNQARFAEMALKRGLYVLSEQPSEGELRVEHVTPDWQGDPEDQPDE